MSDYVKVPRDGLEQVAVLLEILPESETIKAVRALLAAESKPVEEVEVVAYLTPNEYGDPQMLFFERDEALNYVDLPEDAEPLMTVAQHQRILAAHNE